MLPRGTRMQECVCGALGVAGVRLTVPMCVYVAIGRSAVWRTQGVVGRAACVWWWLRVRRACVRDVRSAWYALVRLKSVKLGPTTALSMGERAKLDCPMCGKSHPLPLLGDRLVVKEFVTRAPESLYWVG